MISKNKIRKVIEECLRCGDLFRFFHPFRLLMRDNQSYTISDIVRSELESLLQELKENSLRINQMPGLRRDIISRIDRTKEYIEDLEKELYYSYGITKNIIEKSLQSKKDQLDSDQRWVGRMPQDEEELTVNFETNMNQCIEICEYLLHRGYIKEERFKEINNGKEDS